MYEYKKYSVQFNSTNKIVFWNINLYFNLYSNYHNTANILIYRYIAYCILKYINYKNKLYLERVIAFTNACFTNWISDIVIIF